MLAMWADAKLPDWNAQLVVASLSPAGKREDVIRGILDRRITAGGAGRPSIIFTTPGACGTGMNGLVAANWAVMLDIPFKLHLTHQALGRFRRYGQWYSVHFVILVAGDNDGEQMVYERLKLLGDIRKVLLG